MSQSMKGPAYGNCVMLAPDGVMLCYCDQKKADWYISRKLATVEPPTILQRIKAFFKKEKTPLTFRLNFEPKGRGNIDEPYYLEEKHNRCVVCGHESSLTMHHCVPWMFRRSFPDHYKRHASHDVLPLCIACHHKYEPEADKLKLKISEEIGFPINPPNRYDPVLKRVRSLAGALVRNGNNMGDERCSHMTAVISNYLNRTPTLEDLKTLAKMNTFSKEYLDWCDRSSQIMKGMNAKQLREFAKRWRIHFLETMQPKFMHKNWQVDHWKKEWIEKYGEN